MPMVSYAQNFEDVLLRRAFPPDESGGFYIDVGAAHPLFHSVTRHFHDRGWRGINVEPVGSLYEALVEARPLDINLNVGLSKEEGALTLFEATGSTGRSTFSAAWAEGWRRYDGCEFAPREVPVTTLARVCERYADRPIDFLKIDVEGYERQVLEGADFDRWRPRVVVIEGGPEAGEDLLLAAGYLFATRDGINRYYVEAGDSGRAAALAEPVSLVRDDFVVFDQVRAAEELREALASTERELLASRAEARAFREALDDLGPGAFAMTRRIARVARRHPRLASMASRLLAAT